MLRDAVLLFGEHRHGQLMAWSGRVVHQDIGIVTPPAPKKLTKWGRQVSTDNGRFSLGLWLSGGIIHLTDGSETSAGHFKSQLAFCCVLPSVGHQGQLGKLDKSHEREQAAHVPLTHCLNSGCGR